MRWVLCRAGSTSSLFQEACGCRPDSELPDVFIGSENLGPLRTRQGIFLTSGPRGPGENQDPTLVKNNRGPSPARWDGGPSRSRPGRRRRLPGCAGPTDRARQHRGFTAAQHPAQMINNNRLLIHDSIMGSYATLFEIFSFNLRESRRRAHASARPLWRHDTDSPPRPSRSSLAIGISRHRPCSSCPRPSSSL